MAELIERILELRALKADVCTDGRSALEQIETSEPYDTVISDFRLADNVTGIDVINAVQQSNDRAHCVIISGNLASVDVGRALRHPALLQKPFNVNQFVEAVFPGEG